MPRFDYECDDCAIVKELWIPVDELDRSVSCACGAAMKRLISPFAYKRDINDIVESDPSQLRFWRRQAKWLESNAEDIRSGKLEIEGTGKIKASRPRLMPKGESSST